MTSLWGLELIQWIKRGMRYDFDKFNAFSYRQLRAKRVLSLLNGVPLRETEGHYRCTKSMEIAPFWFSTELIIEQH